MLPKSPQEQRGKQVVLKIHSIVMAKQTSNKRAKMTLDRSPEFFERIMSIGECNTILNAYTLYRHLE